MTRESQELTKEQIEGLRSEQFRIDMAKIAGAIGERTLNELDTRIRLVRFYYEEMAPEVDQEMAIFEGPDADPEEAHGTLDRMLGLTES